jgi:hypothetical protein
MTNRFHASEVHRPLRDAVRLKRASGGRQLATDAAFPDRARWLTPRVPASKADGESSLEGLQSGLPQRWCVILARRFDRPGVQCGTPQARREGRYRSPTAEADAINAALSDPRRLGKS